MERRELLKAAVAGSASFAASQKATSGHELKSAAYVIVELMGHKQLAGRLSQSPVPGLLQLDVPVEGGYSTQLINSSAVYRITIVDEQAVREKMKSCNAMPPICIEDSGYRQLAIEDYGYDDEDGWHR